MTAGWRGFCGGEQILEFAKASDYFHFKAMSATSG